MDRENKKKRGREAQAGGDHQGRERRADAANLQKKKKKKGNSRHDVDAFLDDGADAFLGGISSLGVFEFPWQKEGAGAGVLATSDGSDLRDVFFSSLVDGCSAAIGFPGDRLSPSPAPIDLLAGDDGSWPLDGEEIDGGDCGIWSCALRQPLSALYTKAPIA